MRKLLLICALLTVMAAGAEVPDSVKALPRPVTGYYNLEIGRRDVLATYLSPVRYHGTEFALSGLWTKAMPFNPVRNTMTFQARADFESLLNPAGSASMIGTHAAFSWGMGWQWQFPRRWTLAVGPTVGADGGAYYLIRNSNNPVDAQFSLWAGVSARAEWSFRIRRLPVLLQDRLTMPLLGGFFAPAYGETYYEIYLGNRKGLAHFGYPGNNLRIDNLLSATLDFGRTAMQIGYRFTYGDQYANHLTTRHAGHYFVIGVVPGGIHLKK